MSADLLRDGAAAARRLAAMHKGGRQQAIHERVADWLEAQSDLRDDLLTPQQQALGDRVACDAHAAAVAAAYMGCEQP